MDEIISYKMCACSKKCAMQNCGITLSRLKGGRIPLLSHFTKFLQNFGLVCFIYFKYCTFRIYSYFYEMFIFKCEKCF